MYICTTIMIVALLYQLKNHHDVIYFFIQSTEENR